MTRFLANIVVSLFCSGIVYAMATLAGMQPRLMDALLMAVVFYEVERIKMKAIVILLAALSCVSVVNAILIIRSNQCASSPSPSTQP